MHNDFAPSSFEIPLDPLGFHTASDTTCRDCQSRRTVACDTARKAGAAIGTIADAAGDVSGALSGAITGIEMGVAIGGRQHPLCHRWALSPAPSSAA